MESCSPSDHATSTKYLELTRNMFAMQCSKPMAAKAEIGNQMPTNLPVRSYIKLRGETANRGSLISLLLEERITLETPTRG